MKTKIKKLAFGLALALSAGVLTAAETVKVGVLHSLSGTMAISETSLKDVLLFTFDEINKSGGVMGRSAGAPPSLSLAPIAVPAGKPAPASMIDCTPGQWSRPA